MTASDRSESVASGDAEGMHREVWSLLPWYVNGSLDPREERLVRAHVGQCLTCRREVEALGLLQRQVRDSDLLDESLARGLTDLRTRIEATRHGSFATGRSTASLARWGGLALAQAALLLVAVAATVLVIGQDRPVEESPGFVTLSDVAPPARNDSQRLRAMFAPTVTEAALRELLVSAGAVIVAGPTSTGVYTLAVRGGEGPAALEQLRADAAVRFVEQVGP